MNIDDKIENNNFGNDYTNFVLSSSDLTREIKNILHSNQFAKIVKEYISQTEISISEFFDDYKFKLAENGIIEIEKQSFDMQSDDLLDIIEIDFSIDNVPCISAINGIYENDYIIYYKPLNKKSNPENEIDVYSIVELLNNKSDYIDRSNFNLLKSLIKQANNENKKRYEIELLINTQTEQTKPVQATKSPNNGIVEYTYLSKGTDNRYSFVFEKTDLKIKDISNAIGYLMPKLGYGMKPNFSKKSYEYILTNKLFNVSPKQKGQIKSQLSNTLFEITKNNYSEEPLNQHLVNELFKIISNSKS